MDLGGVKNGFFALFLITLNCQLLLICHEVAIDCVHGLGPHPWLPLLVLKSAIVLVDLCLRRLHLGSGLRLGICWPIIVIDRVIGQYVEAPVQGLLVALQADLVHLHLLLALELSHPVLPRVSLDVIAHLEALLLVLVPQILLVQAVVILDVHVYRIVHETLLLHGDGQLLHLVLAMHLGLGLAFSMRVIKRLEGLTR